jgi:hypothetical protein
VGTTTIVIGTVLTGADMWSTYDPTRKAAERMVKRRIIETFVARYGSYQEAVLQNAAPPVYELLQQGWTVDELIEFGVIKCIK